MHGDDSLHIRQASAVPGRLANGEFEICLITTGRGLKWGFPKGTIGGKYTPTIAALSEAYEEAGLRGTVIDEALASYRYRKAGRSYHVDVVLMHVTQCESFWIEQERRRRAWLGPEEALRRLTRKRLRQILDEAIARLQKHGVQAPVSDLLTGQTQQRSLP